VKQINRGSDMTARSTARFGGALSIVLCSAITSCGGGSSQPPQQGPSAYREQILADHPEGYWRLDEKTGTVAFDQSANANSGRIAEGVLLDDAGATRGDGDAAMFFGGTTGEIVIPTSPSLQLEKGSVTLEAWIKLGGPQTGVVTILGKGRSGVQTEYGLILVDGVPGYQSVVERYMSKGSLTPGVWTHVAVTVENNAVGTIYVDGTVAATFMSATNHTVSRSTEPVTIAGQAGASARFFGGIDEPAIYSYPLKAAQVAAHVALATGKSRP
jgi:hypothetical protein